MNGGVFQGVTILTETNSLPKQRHHDGKYNFCNRENMATLPASRFSAAADFQDRIPADVSSTVGKTKRAGNNKKETGVVTG